ncbi:MAG: CD36 family protein [Candidatus Thalassarchaeum sp.]|nr:CD36 family protein [Candidatus Thalassarchaeum sp.]
MNAKALALGIVGILLMGINLAVISPFVMEVTEETLSTATVMDNETWEDEEWLNATSERSFFAWNLSNAAALQSGAETEMEFEQLGPFTYELTTKREVLYHDVESGVLTYREYNVYNWLSGESGDTQLTNINILFNTQKIGAVGSAIDFGSSFVKGAFTRDMLYVDLSERAPSIWVSNDLTDAGEEAIRAEVAWGDSEDDNTTLHHVLYDAKDPGDSSVCIALTCDIGSMLMVRLGAPDNGSNSLARASMFGYTGADDAETFERDHAIYNVINTRFANHGGGAHLESASHESLNERLDEMTGVTINDEPTLQNLLFGVVDGTNVGMLKCDSQKILCGSTNILQGALEDPFAVVDDYTLNPADRFGYTDMVGIVQNWAGNWFTAVTKYEMILSGGEGWIHADEWFYEAFGSIDPINNEYITLGLNQQGAWGLVYGDVVDLDAEVTATLFEGEHRITGDFAIDFMYGEIMGYSVPMDENFIPTPGGEVHVWDEALVAQIYNLDNNSANALRWLFSYTVFDQFLEPLLEQFLDVVPYKTQSINQWLFGWEDPLSGWVSLEKNATFFGCGDTDVDGPCSTDSASVYSVYTGAVGDHEPGQIIAEDGDIHLPWRTPARNESAYGLLDPVVQTGAVGSYYDATKPAMANLGGYAVQTSEITGTGSVHGIETQTHTFTLDPLENPIQAKLLAQENVLDIFPGALPVYFGGEVVMEMEPTVNAAIAGDLNSYFYLDTRGIGAVDPTMEDLQPVFQISQSSSMTEAQSEDFKDLVITNTQPYSYWANLDTGADAFYIDQITMMIWILAIMSLLGCSYVAKTSGRDPQEIDWNEEE